jgi:hypothetical protein
MLHSTWHCLGKGGTMPHNCLRTCTGVSAAAAASAAAVEHWGCMCLCVGGGVGGAEYIKIPYRATQGRSHEEQMLNHLNRHQSFNDLMDKLQPLRDELEADEEEAINNRPNLGVAGATSCTHALLAPTSLPASRTQAEGFPLQSAQLCTHTHAWRTGC